MKFSKEQICGLQTSNRVMKGGSFFKKLHIQGDKNDDSLLVEMRVVHDK